MLHLGQLDFLAARQNVIFLGPPGTGKTHLAIALGIRACLAGHRTLFASATTWVTRLAAAQREHRADRYLAILDRWPLLVVDEVGYLPFDAEAASLFFQLVNARYERGSLIVTSNKPFTAWGEIFGDATVAAAMLDRPGPPRRDPQPERRQLPPQGQAARPHARAATDPRLSHSGGLVFGRRKWPTFRSLTTHERRASLEIQESSSSMSAPGPSHTAIDPLASGVAQELAALERRQSCFESRVLRL